MAVVHFLNVGHGDCSIIQHNSGRVTVVDVSKAWAPESNSLKTAMARLEKAADDWVASRTAGGNFNQKIRPENPIEYMRAHAIGTIFRFVLTHPDMDHMDGIQAVFEAFEVLNFWDTQNTAEKDFGGGGGSFNKDDWDFYLKLRAGLVATTKRLTLHSGDSGPSWNLPGDDGSQDGLHILAPTADLVASANDCGDFNDCSYVLLYRVEQFRILFCGDSHDKTWNHLLAHHRDAIANIDVLIAPHHGRDSDRDFAFLDVVKPRVSLLGNANSEHLAYGAWNQRDLATITNNQAGTIVISVTETALSLFATNEAYARRTTYGYTHFDQTLKAWFIGRYEAQAKAA